MDQKARMKYRKDCDEVFPGIIVGNGECIKDVRFLLSSHRFQYSITSTHCSLYPTLVNFRHAIKLINFLPLFNMNIIWRNDFRFF